MRKIFVCGMLLFCAVSSYAQEEFHGKDGGISGSFELSYLDRDIDVVTTRYSIVLSDVVMFSYGGIEFDDVSARYFTLGLISKIKDEDTYSRAYIGFTPTIIERETLWGMNFGGMVCMNSHSSFPTSLSAAYSCLKNFKDKYNPPESAIGVSVSQAFGAKMLLYPVLSMGLSRPLSYEIDQIAIVSLSAGLNLTF